jgi:Bacterial TSP3 repeat
MPRLAPVLSHSILTLSAIAAAGAVQAQPLGGARCADPLCLVYLVPVVDSDGDGVSDADEKAAGTDPEDASSHPPALDIAKLARQGRFESFNRGLSEVVVLPTHGPDGKALVSSEVRDLRGPTLEALGITDKTLSRFGMKSENGFSLSSAWPTSIAQEMAELNGSKGSTPPPVKVGGIQIALYSADENGVDMGPGFCTGCKNPDGETVKTEGSWWDKVVEFFGGSSDGGSGDKPDGGQPDAGTYTDPDAVPVIPISEADFKKVWFKVNGGTVSRTAGDDLPSPLDEEPPVLGRNPNGPIMLVNPEESDEYLGSMRKIIVIQDPGPRHTSDENTNFGPRLGPIIVGGAQPGSAVPKEY